MTLHCPGCWGTKIKRNGKKSYGMQNYSCKNCGRPCIAVQNLSFFPGTKDITDACSRDMHQIYL
ncbi:MAG: hypothetical protein LBL90_05825 [Prevotellaceae bacterium]|nr:hypothetical protein [Prevotellaceae bacterium]